MGRWGENLVNPVPQGDSPAGQAGLLRQFCESVIVLAVAVLLFREFMAEGYLISTGSMAPCLLGFHRQVECPACHCRFASGVIVRDEESRPGEARAQDLYADELRDSSLAKCPNCGFSQIPTEGIPRNEGDQLMVHKNAFEFRDPRRWEVIVFRNPADPSQAYVKRVVARPGETVSIVDGDIVVDGRVQRKPLTAQQGMRILVDDLSHQPQSADDAPWQPRWIPETDGHGWRSEGGRLEFGDPDQGGEDPGLDWLVFRHWIREGGRHVTTTLLNDWPAGLGPPPPTGRSLSYHVAARALSCVGVLGDAERDRWLTASSNPEFQQAVRTLAAASHEAPIVDQYAYNRRDDQESQFVVRDLMISCVVDAEDRWGRLDVELDDGRHRYRAELDFTRGAAELMIDEGAAAIDEANLPDDLSGAPLRLEMSLMDQQALVAINGRLLFAPAAYDDCGRNGPAPRRPLRIGAAGGRIRLSEVQVFRDVYYTPKSEGRLPRRMGADEFFVLGDNSPVSLDSRCWDDPAVHREDLVGKPLVVHLPSRQATLTLLGRTRTVRVPDFSRVRYIH